MSEYLLSVANISLIDNKTGLQLATATLKSHNISQSVDTTDIRAGWNNELLTRIKTNKTVTISIEDVCQNRDFIAAAFGSTVEAKKAITGRTVAKEYTYATAGVTLSPAPKNASASIQCWLADGTVKTGTVSGGKITIEGADEGEVVMVGSYEYAATTGDYIGILSDKFSGTYTLVMEEPVYDLDVNIIAYKKSVFPRVQADDSFELGGTSEQSETTVSYNFTALKAKGSNELGYFYYEPAE